MDRQMGDRELEPVDDDADENKPKGLSEPDLAL